MKTCRKCGKIGIFVLCTLLKKYNFKVWTSGGTLKFCTRCGKPIDEEGEKE
jgi:hypothetical protein